MRWPWSREKKEIPPPPPPRDVPTADDKKKNILNATEDIRKRLLDIEAEVLGGR